MLLPDLRLLKSPLAHKLRTLGPRPMVLVTKRVLLIAGISLLILFTIAFPSAYLPRSRLGASSSNPPMPASVGCPAVPPPTPYVPTNHSRFNWRHVPIKHPVAEFAELPRTQPNSLRPVQFDFKTHQLSASALSTQASRQQQVKDVFTRCWSSYKAKAWLRDELAPLSGQSKDTFGGWGATLVDSLDVLSIMGMDAELEEAVAAAVDIDFGPNTSSLQTVNMFETTIRYLGGFIAAYDLSSCKDSRLLDKAVEIGDMIYASYDTPNRMPITRWNPRTAVNGGIQDAADNAIIAELASSSVEFTRLSFLTGDMRWFDAAQRITNLLDQQQDKTKLPGMWPKGINVRDMDLTTGSSFTFGAMSDSAYEYLAKTFQLLGGADPAVGAQYEKLYRSAMSSASDHILFRPNLPDAADVLFPATFDAASQKLDPRAEHLGCFAGGMLALGGRLFGIDQHLDLGRRVTDGCVWAYNHSRHGIMPESFRAATCTPNSDCRSDGDGFGDVDDARYILRPEAIESVFYLYRITGEQRWQEVAWNMFESIENITHTELANAAIKDVTLTVPEKEDSMESFWMAETLKYFYLVFSDPELISLDDFVFNTEAHPFRRPKR